MPNPQYPNQLSQDAANSPIGQAFAPQQQPSRGLAAMNQAAQMVHQASQAAPGNQANNPGTTGQSEDADPTGANPSIAAMTPERMQALLAEHAAQMSRAPAGAADDESQHPTYSATQ